MKKYISPSYELDTVVTKDIITSSIEDNGESTYEYKGKVITGNKGTFGGLFSEIY